MNYRRPQSHTLSKRLFNEPRRFLQVVAGPRQVGKTTLVRQVLEDAPLPCVYASADEPGLKGTDWLHAQWNEARVRSKGSPTILALDEIQKIQGWSEVVKRLWDEDTAAGNDVRVVVLGSAPLLIDSGLTESLTGRFETIHLGHWPFEEIEAAFGLSMKEFAFFGGYPGAIPLIGEEARWRSYILESLIETTISRDVLLLNPVNKPALLRRVFELACVYSGQELSYQKMVGQLQDAGNTTTLAHYLDLLARSGMVAGLQKYAGQHVRRRGSSPKLQVFNTALMTAQSGRDFRTTTEDGAHWGRVMESMVGAHLLNLQRAGELELFYWRDGPHEVDFVVVRLNRVSAIEVKSARLRGTSGLSRFEKAHGTCRKFILGDGATPISEFLKWPVADWA